MGGRASGLGTAAERAMPEADLLRALEQAEQISLSDDDLRIVMEAACPLPARYAEIGPGVGGRITAKVQRPPSFHGNSGAK